MNKSIKLFLFYSIVTTGLILYFVLYHVPSKLEKGIYMPNPQPIIHFSLTDNKGRLFTEKNLKNHWSLLIFGFSSCELVCPLTLQMLKHVYEGLPTAKRPQIILVSVDPKNDSVQKLNQFVNKFNNQFIALQGSMSEVNSLQKALHVTISKKPKSHGTEIPLINPEGKVQVYFNFPITSRELLADLNRVFEKRE
jgi:protein SCO1/2